ncbi:hypothetical protein NHH03_11485 [Stieleria sp. TO1_6]|uniref:hypothetical protein n=1 Tax=Stieleria tagensis TaxID=2956795 RepID=UPI00209B0885|nr:hypothetical protein [Stieleria tagensis]MCO8122359.1 hypothetical protein [Stieleria tagensis]
MAEQTPQITQPLLATGLNETGIVAVAAKLVPHGDSDASSQPLAKMMSQTFRLTVFAFAVLLPLAGVRQFVRAQIPVALSPTAAQSKQPSLAEYLVNRLRATSTDQRSYVAEIVKLVEEGKLERRLLIALERYARRKSPYFPLPVFERALRVEAAKRGVAVPMIKEIVARNGETAARAVSDSRIR